MNSKRFEETLENIRNTRTQKNTLEDFFEPDYIDNLEASWNIDQVHEAIDEARAKNTQRITVAYTFEVTYDIVAETEQQAHDIAMQDCWLNMWEIHTSNDLHVIDRECNGIADYEIVE